MPIVFHALEPVVLKQRRLLKKFIIQLFIKEKKSLQSIDIIFCSDEYLLGINKQHLQHDFYTDIITFDLSESSANPIIGELYISIDRVKDNAALRDEKFSTELLRVIFHGLLHLCGFKDKTKSDIKTMREKEDEYLGLYNNS